MRAIVAVAILLAACQKQGQPAFSVPGGDPDRGKEQIIAYGCGSCHLVPGIRQAKGLVGPPLTHFARRAYIAGEVPNSPDFLVRWITVPQAIEPGTVMPNLGVSEARARDIAAYLYTLK
jgi:cytochrome c